jgi:hypothetical protein
VPSSREKIIPQIGFKTYSIYGTKSPINNPTLGIAQDSLTVKTKIIS